MEDLAGKINDILGNPDLMNQIKNFSGILADSKNKQTNQKNSQEEMDNSNFELPNDILETFLKLAPVLSSIKSEDKYTRFLKALKPLLSVEKQKKIDNSFSILQIIKILPLLKNKGFF